MDPVKEPDQIVAEVDVKPPRKQEKEEDKCHQKILTGASRKAEK